MSEINVTRDYYFNKGLSVSEIHRETGFAHKTIQKYIDQEDFSIQCPLKKGKPSKLEPYYEIIDDWLAKDKLCKPKQRHTASRVYARLQKEYPAFDGKYRIVATYVKVRRKEIFSRNSCYIALDHPHGEAQVDFGKAEYIENGEKISGSYLVIVLSIQ